MRILPPNFDRILRILRHVGYQRPLSIGAFGCIVSSIACHQPIFITDKPAAAVSVHRDPHLLCCRTVEIQQVVCAPDALHLTASVECEAYVTGAAPCPHG